METPAEGTLPSGTVTFLLTDVVGSTALWQAEPRSMEIALARHDEVVETVVARHAGVVVKPRGEGDSSFAVFARAPDAVTAALDISLALAAETWATSSPLELRVAIHTGVADLRSGDYYGHDVNRAARLRSTGHPRQVLLSAASAHLVRDLLPSKAVIRSLGRHSLKDIDGEEEVFQLCHPALPSDFPPIRSAAGVRHNLPVALTSFIGRERERADVAALLASHRLVTLIGPGGAGKTRLALQVARELVADVTDGVWFVELGPLDRPALVVDAVAAAIGLKPEPGRQTLATLVDRLRPSDALIVLDNCEHLVSAVAALAHEVLLACPQLTLLATSRERLGVAGEVSWLVAPLAAPEPGPSPRLEELAQFEAVQLFCERARAVRPGFVVTAANSDAVARICQGLDGLPLALELAAARIRVLGPAEIVTRLDQRLHLLTGGGRMTVERHRTLAAAIDWSYELLSGQEQKALRRLAVFAGGATLEAAEAVIATDGRHPEDVLDLVTALVDKSLVLAREAGPGVRYQLLETVRQYALAKLAPSEEEEVRDRHLAWFVELASKPVPDGSAHDEALNRLGVELDNVRHALAWAEKRSGQSLLTLATSLGQFWEVRGFLDEGRRWLELGLAGGSACSPEVRAHAHRWTGVLAQRQGDFDAARRHYDSSLALSREVGDIGGTASALHSLGNIEGLQGHRVAAAALYEESLAAGRTMGDARIVAASLTNLGWLAQTQSDFEAARQFTDESLAAWRTLADPHGEAQALTALAYLGLMQGDHEEVRSRCAQSLAIQRRLGDRYGEAWSLTYLGWAAQNEGDISAAAALHLDALAIRRDLGDRYGKAWSLSHLGDVERARKDYERSEELLTDSLEIAKDLGDTYCVAWSLLRLGRLAAARDVRSVAVALFREGLSVAGHHRDKVAVATCLEGLAAILADGSQFQSAARLLGAAAEVRRLIGAPRPHSDQAIHDRALGSVRNALGVEQFGTLASAAAQDDVESIVRELALKSFGETEDD